MFNYLSVAVVRCQTLSKEQNNIEWKIDVKVRLPFVFDFKQKKINKQTICHDLSVIITIW